MGYIRNILISLDQFINVLFGGKPDETISSRLGRAKVGQADRLAEALQEPICEILDKVEPNHCEASIEFTPDGKESPHHLK